MTVIINSLLGAIGAGILTLIVLLIKYVWKKMQVDAYTLKALIHDAFYRDCRYLLSKESRTQAEAENIEHLYKAYKSQGLNGTGDQMYDMVKEIPIDKMTI